MSHNLISDEHDVAYNWHHIPIALLVLGKSEFILEKL